MKYFTEFWIFKNKTKNMKKINKTKNEENNKIKE